MAVYIALGTVTLLGAIPAWAGRHLDLGRDLARFDALLRHHTPGLVIVDDFGLFLGDTANTEARPRAAMHGLGQIAEQTQTPIVAIQHLAKARRGQAVHAGSGRVAPAGTARSVTIVRAHPEDPSLRVWASAKNNLGPIPPSLLYEITDTPLGPVVNWLGTTDWSADEVPRTTTGDRTPKAIEAEQMLREMLADGPRLRSDIKTAATHRPIGWRTVEAAKATLGIRHSQIPEPGIRGPGPCWWSMPDTDEGSLP